MEATALIMQLAPLLLMQGIYAVVVGLFAAKQRMHVALRVILTLVPVFGLFYGAFFNLTTMLRVLDRLNKLEVTQPLS